MERKRLIIIGAGPGGYVAAIRASQLGNDVTIIEQDSLGGTCLNWGCIPTKSIISSVDLLEKIKHSADHGITINGEINFNITDMIARKNKIVGNLVKGIGSLLKSHNVKVIKGRGVIVGNKSVEVTDNGKKTVIECDGIIISTGSSPYKIPAFPFDSDYVITSDEAVNMTRVPNSILIVGAGVIGVEFAFIYNMLGSRVIMVEMMPNAVATCDLEISQLLEREMKKRKINLFTNTKVDKIEVIGTSVHVFLNNQTSHIVDMALVSIGRNFNSANIGLETIGVRTEKGRILVNEKMETNVEGVYAIGDVIGGLMLAHVASAEGKVASENFSGHNSVMDYSVVPAGIFSTPEIGNVGLTTQEAERMNIPIKTGKFSFKSLGKAHASGESTGVVKIIADANTNKILGGHIIGPHATDLIHEVAVAMKNNINADGIAHTIHAHPTLAEGVVEAAEDILDIAIHLPKKL